MLQKYSYSALDQMDKCSFSFYLKYVKGLYPRQETLATILGSLLHKAKETISRSFMASSPPSYDAIWQAVLHDGFPADTDAEGKPQEPLPSIDYLKTQYADEWNAPDEKSGLSYSEKLEIFHKGLRKEEEEQSLWRTIGAEVPFDIEYDGIRLHGFIDKIQENPKGQLRIVDYKTSKKIYGDTQIKTPLQMYVYHLAVSQLYPDKEIIQYLYDFILIGQEQEGGSKGWLARADKKLKKLVNAIETNTADNLWTPSPSPLCHWCPFCITAPSAPSNTRGQCPYYSLWTPENKTFQTNAPFDPDSWVIDTEAYMERNDALSSFRW